jgi:hypothetical protein
LTCRTKSLFFKAVQLTENRCNLLGDCPGKDPHDTIRAY